MKNIVFFTLGLVILMGLSVTAFADQVEGQVQSVNAMKNEIVVKDGTSGADRTVTVHPRIISTLQQGSVVKVALKPGTNAADTVEARIG